MRTLVLLALAAAILAAGTVALWSRAAPGRVHYDDVPLVHYGVWRSADPRPSATQALGQT